MFLMLGVIGLAALTPIMDFATAGTLGTNEQSVFDVFPFLFILMAVFLITGAVVLAARTFFKGVRF
tara:strand:+ start:2644 stop:2841 length:198 start_codon:yes stop_codon:yes gene_type:complete